MSSCQYLRTKLVDVINFLHQDFIESFRKEFSLNYNFLVHLSVLACLREIQVAYSLVSKQEVLFITIIILNYWFFFP